jgi:hypothetical protein
MDLSRRFKHSELFRLIVSPFEIIRYKWRMFRGTAKFITDRPWRADKVTRTICGHCSAVLLSDTGARAYAIEGQSKYPPRPLPVVGEHEGVDVMMSYATSHHFHFPLVCRECGTRLYNAYAFKVLKILVIVFY